VNAPSRKEKGATMAYLITPTFNLSYLHGIPRTYSEGTSSCGEHWHAYASCEGWRGMHSAHSNKLFSRTENKQNFSGGEA